MFERVADFVALDSSRQSESGLVDAHPASITATVTAPAIENRVTAPRTCMTVDFIVLYGKRVRLKLVYSGTSRHLTAQVQTNGLR